MEYPFNHNKIKFYRYFFYEIEKPVTIEARNREDARAILRELIESLPKEYKNSRIVGESVTIPLLGISEKKINGVKFIWVGERIKALTDGWKR